MTENRSIVIECALRKDGSDVLQYSETSPGGVCKTFYLSRLAAYFLWGEKPPEKIRITVERVTE
jgi:hypothetical protein